MVMATRRKVSTDPGPVAEAFEPGTQVWHSPICFRGSMTHYRVHNRLHMDTTASIVSHSEKGDEVFMYLVGFDDGCQFWAPPWDVTLIDHDGG